MSFGITGPVTLNPWRGGGRNTEWMSVAVGVLGWNRAAIAADSHYVDLSTWELPSVTKTVNENQRIGALTGLSSLGRKAFTDFLSTAMVEAPTLQEVDQYFLRIGGNQLVAAYELLHQQFGIGPNEFPIQLLVAGRVGRRVAMVEARTYQDEGGLRIVSRIRYPSLFRSKCMAIGASSPVEHRVEDVRSSTFVSFKSTPPHFTRGACSAEAVSLVQEVIAQEATIPRPEYYTLRGPVVSGPVSSEDL
jgi:hypothetical protein